MQTTLKGLPIKLCRSKIHLAEFITSLDVAEDLAILSNTVKDAKSLLDKLGEATSYVGLYCDSQKTEFISSKNYAVIHTFNTKQLKQVTDFKYLG